MTEPYRPYGGLCVGGPWDGLGMSHTKRHRPLWSEASRDRRAEYIGDYVFNSQHKEWEWQPSERIEKGNRPQ